MGLYFAFVLLFIKYSGRITPASASSEMNPIYIISRIATFFRKYRIFLKKSSILNITGGTPEFACATLAGKKIVFDQKPPLLREQAVGSSQENGIYCNSYSSYYYFKNKWPESILRRFRPFVFSFSFHLFLHHLHDNIRIRNPFCDFFFVVSFFVIHRSIFIKLC